MSHHRSGSRGAAARLLKRHTQKSSSWRDHLDNWRLFTAAAGASLAAATTADAGIVYSGPVDLTVSIPTTGSQNSIKTFSINENPMRIHIRNSYDMGRHAVAKLQTHAGKLKLGVNGSGDAIKYSVGNPIGPNLGSQRSFAVLRSHNPAFNQGPFGPGTVTGFVGVKTHNGDLGWIQVKVSDAGSSSYPNEVEVIDYAYNSTPDVAITAGDTGAVPEPSSIVLGLLGSGAVGLMAWRQRKAAMKTA